MGPTLKEEALDNHSTVSRVGKQKYSTEKKKPSRRKRLSDLFPFQEVTGKEATRDQKKRKKEKREEGTRSVVHLCLKSTDLASVPRPFAAVGWIEGM